MVRLKKGKKKDAFSRAVSNKIMTDQELDELFIEEEEELNYDI